MNLKKIYNNLLARYKRHKERSDKVSLLLRNVYPKARKMKYCLDKIGVPQDDQELRCLYISDDDMELALSIHWDRILGLKLMPINPKNIALQHAKIFSNILKHDLKVTEDMLLDYGMFGISCEPVITQNIIDRDNAKAPFLQEDDIIELFIGHEVYADIPKHFVYQNERGIWELTHAHVVIDGQFEYLAGRYIVYKAVKEGGGTGHGSGDIYYDGYHVYAQKEDGTKVDFYQSGSFTAMITDIWPIGKATQSELT